MVQTGIHALLAVRPYKVTGPPLASLSSHVKENGNPTYLKGRLQRKYGVKDGSSKIIK